MVEIRTESLTKKFRGELEVKAVDDISIILPENKIVLIAGPSGSGKTTLLRAVAGLAKTNSGRIFNGTARLDIRSPREREIGFVFDVSLVTAKKKIKKALEGEENERG